MWLVSFAYVYVLRVAVDARLNEGAFLSQLIYDRKNLKALLYGDSEGGWEDMLT